MKRIKLSTTKLQISKEKIADLTNLEMRALNGGSATSGQSPCLHNGFNPQLSALNPAQCPALSTACPSSDVTLCAMSKALNC
jgi:hypothetical protein